MVHPLIAIVAVIVVAVSVIFGVTSFTQVQVGQRGLVQTYGALDENSPILDPGMRFINPISQHVIYVPVAHQIVNADEAASSHDLQDVHTAITLEYNVDPTQVRQLYTTYLGDQNNVLIIPTVHDTIKAVTAKYTVDQLITSRESVKSDMEKALRDKLAQHGIIVAQVSITDFTFSADYHNAIEAKQVAQQNAEQAQNTLKQKQIEAEYTVAAAQGRADAAIAEAKGQAEAIKIQSQALKDNPEYYQLLALNKWQGNVPNVMGSGVTPFIDVSKYATGGK